MREQTILPPPRAVQTAELVGLLITARLKTLVKGRWLGFWWWLLEPLAMTLTYMFLVQMAFRAGTPQFALFLMCAVLPWTWFSSATARAMNSIVGHANILKAHRVHYAVFPTSEVLAMTMRFMASLVILAFLMIYYRVTPTIHVMWLPLLVAAQLTFTLGCSYWLALSQVFVEDTHQVWQIMCRVWFLLSPSIYAAKSLPEWCREWYMLNPFATIFCSYRSVFIEGQPPALPALIVVLGIGLVLMVGGHAALGRVQGRVPLHL